VTARLNLTRARILAFRRHIGALNERLPTGPRSLRRAAWAGLQDSMPRAALLSIHARVEGAMPTTWDDPSLVQVWGPRFSAYVIAAEDLAVFSLGRMSDDPGRRRIAEDLADRLCAFLGDGRTTYSEAGKALGENPNQLRYAATTGTILIRWEGARRPTIWCVPRPHVDPADARLELARRYLHVFGPSTPESFARWAGIRRTAGPGTFEALGESLLPVRTPIGDAWILASDEASFRVEHPVASARLLPSGDAYFLLSGNDRMLLVENPDLHSELWPSRVWPGALLIAGEIVGTWRRAAGTVSVRPWRSLSRAERDDVETEAVSLPLPDLRDSIVVRWDD